MTDNVQNIGVSTENGETCAGGRISASAAPVKLDLLYLDEEDNACTNDGVVYDLSLDRAFEYIEPDNNRRREFLKVLSNPPKGLKNIQARQQTL
nr:hypothetical protein [Clostridia bacterium]